MLGLNSGTSMKETKQKTNFKCQDLGPGVLARPADAGFALARGARAVGTGHSWFADARYSRTRRGQRPSAAAGL